MKPIEDYEGLYAITKKGKVWAFPRERNTAKIVRRFKGSWIGCKRKDGYHVARLTKDKIEKSHYLHRLLAAAFLPNPKNLPYINHIDGDKSNNKLKNLEWCTHSHNVKHAYIIGKHNSPKGEAVLSAKLNSTEVLEIRRFCLQGLLTYRQIGALYGVSKGLIGNIHNRRKWKHI